MRRGRELARKYFKVSQSELVVGDVPVSEIAQRFGTPLYLYDIDLLTQKFEGLSNGLNESIHLFYSVKANPSLALCNHFYSMGSGAEIASRGELEIALKAGFPPEKIVFAGPGKKGSELESSIKRGILSINVESLNEIREIGRIARRIDKIAAISLRINPQKNVSGSQLHMGGYASPFGLDEETIPEALELIRAEKYLDLIGIHVYVGSQIFDYRLAISHMENVIQIARTLSESLFDQRLKYVNLGGGLAIPYYKNQKFFEEELFKKELNRIVENCKRETIFQDTQFIVESGRYLVAECGVFLTRVVHIKESRGKTIAVVDGGMNFNSMATGNLGQKIPRKFPIVPAGGIDAVSSTMEIDIVGPLCTPMDLYGRSFQCPALREGDLLGVLLAGAYGLTASPVHFLSHTGCAEVTVSSGNVHLIRKPKTTEQIFADQFFIGN